MIGLRWHDNFGMCVIRWDPEKGRQVCATVRAWYGDRSIDSVRAEAMEALAQRDLKPPPWCTKCGRRVHGVPPKKGMEK